LLAILATEVMPLFRTFKATSTIASHPPTAKVAWFAEVVFWSQNAASSIHRTRNALRQKSSATLAYRKIQLIGTFHNVPGQFSYT
jgi:hypothetical protein